MATEKATGTCWLEGWVGHRTDLKEMKGEISVAHTGSEAKVPQFARV